VGTVWESAQVRGKCLGWVPKLRAVWPIQHTPVAEEGCRPLPVPSYLVKPPCTHIAGLAFAGGVLSCPDFCLCSAQSICTSQNSSLLLLCFAGKRSAKGGQPPAEYLPYTAAWSWLAPYRKSMRLQRDRSSEAYSVSVSMTTGY